LLKLLIEHAPRVISRDEILNQLWGEDKFPTQRTIDNSIVRLRQAISDTDGKWIRSVRGVGYQWAKEGTNE
ncbi:MAG TPA: winged helix-turn-helix domain-containing protein, partial [Bdellovibrionales bacterium]|nr:winged helix-turn-helix domain-containing protein [Bdellovibrionales bacterium]